MNGEATMNGMDEAGGHDEGGHASVGFYWMIGAVLTVITAVEVAVFYIPALAGILVPLLLVLSVAKFCFMMTREGGSQTISRSIARRGKASSSGDSPCLTG